MTFGPTVLELLRMLRPNRRLPPPPTVDYWRVTTDYFSAAGIPLIAGRTFDAQDPYDVETNRPTRVIINEALARQFFREGNAVGRSIRILPRKGATRAPREIIGIV